MCAHPLRPLRPSPRGVSPRGKGLSRSPTFFKVECACHGIEAGDWTRESFTSSSLPRTGRAPLDASGSTGHVQNGKVVNRASPLWPAGGWLSREHVPVSVDVRYAVCVSDVIVRPGASRAKANIQGYQFLLFFAIENDSNQPVKSGASPNPPIRRGCAFKPVLRGFQRVLKNQRIPDRDRHF